ncbi:carbohydrate kinase family protein [Pelosinus sp. UFO1]|uniref:carbohydrate kinase family protein n=1 Tax=Pelosinus sp. UFO1 TaxID=484770 RepID=UPI0004D0F574|nr:carbohydrate kinase family protein [Pelosinus sp. UFO1]AIF53250.1 PfkB domain protein [Pelosinus sp. UFO1]
MKVGIVGPISKDHVTLPTGDKVEKYGAVAYSVLALAKLFEGTKDEVVCLSHISLADAPSIYALLNDPNIILSHMHVGRKEGTEIQLTYINSQERVSQQIRSMSPIALKEVKLLADCQCILLMPLNETDIPLACAKEWRRVSHGTIFLDVHGLVTGVTKEGKRFNKYWENPKEWLGCIDILKMNAKEAQWVAGHEMGHYKEYVEYATSVVKEGLTACWITFGDQSSLVAWKRDERILWANVPVVRDFGPVVDTTGCGDSASAGFVYSYAKIKNPLLGVILGNTFGSLKASFQGLNGFPSQPEVRGIVHQHYRDYLHNLLDDFLSKSQVMIHESKEGTEDESFVFHPDGHWYDNGTNHASGSNRQGTSTPGSRH